MGKSKSRKRKGTKNLEPEPADSEIPIPNLPEKFLLMRVKSGTKIRNVLGYALKEFSNYDGVVWTAVGQGIGKAISCSELFKRNKDSLHQITKLRYVESEKSKTEGKSDANAETRHVPEIHILLARKMENTSEPGYQAPNDNGEFLSDQETENRKRNEQQEIGGGPSSINVEEFAAMGLRTGQKRAKKEQHGETPSKRNKKRENGDR